MNHKTRYRRGRHRSRVYFSSLIEEAISHIQNCDLKLNYIIDSLPNTDGRCFINMQNTKYYIMSGKRHARKAMVNKHIEIINFVYGRLSNHSLKKI